MYPIVFSVAHDVPHVVLPFHERPFGETRRDLFVSHIVKDILMHISGSSVFGEVPRVYLDYNRPPNLAYTDQRLAQAYDRYHTQITMALGARGILFDMHGFSPERRLGRDFDLIFASSTEKAKDLDVTLATTLREFGYRVFASDCGNESLQDGIFSPGYTTQRNATLGHFACQVEITDRFRKQNTRELGKKLSRDFAQALRLFLETRDSLENFERNRENDRV